MSLGQAKQLDYGVDALIREARRQLMEAGVDNAALDARLLMQHVLGVTQEQILSGSVADITDDEARYFMQLVARRVQMEPVAKIIGSKPFWKDIFLTTKDTLDPRPDTEVLIEAVLMQMEDKLAPLRFLDLGTGTGCIILSLLREYPFARGVAVDASKAALHVAERNARALRLMPRVDFVESDWLSSVDGRFDVIVSNPPYISQSDFEGLSVEVRDHDPTAALVAGDDGLDAYRVLLPQAVQCLVDGGWMFVEVGVGQAPHVAEIARQVGLCPEAYMSDLAGIARVVVLRQRSIDFL
jgi:release factor glutamine methyltransferase